MNVYNEKYPSKYAIRISSKNFELENNIKSVPLYAFFCMEDLVKLETSKAQEKIRQQKNDLKKVEKEIDNYLNK